VILVHARDDAPEIKEDGLDHQATPNERMSSANCG
jgi:hypothetical protein